MLYTLLLLVNVTVPLGKTLAYKARSKPGHVKADRYKKETNRLTPWAGLLAALAISLAIWARARKAALSLSQAPHIKAAWPLSERAQIACDYCLLLVHWINFKLVDSIIKQPSNRWGLVFIPWKRGLMCKTTYPSQLTRLPLQQWRLHWCGEAHQGEG